MENRVLSIVIDAAHVETIVSRIVDAIDEGSSSGERSHDALDTYLVGSLRRSIVFWLPLMTALPSISDDEVFSVRTFLFDAAYARSSFEMHSPSGDVDHGGRPTMLKKAVRRASAYGFVPKDLFPSDILGSPPGTARVFTTLELATPFGDMSIDFLFPGLSVVRSALDVPERPGLYWGHLSIDRIGPKKIGQKTVDTMATICMLLEAQQHHTVILYGEDADFIPAASYASTHGQSFHVCAFRAPSKHWKIAERSQQRLVFHPLRVPVPVPSNWTQAQVDAAVERVEQALRRSPGSAYAIRMGIPPMDVDMLNDLQRWDPAGMRVSPLEVK